MAFISCWLSTHKGNVCRRFFCRYAPAVMKEDSGCDLGSDLANIFESLEHNLGQLYAPGFHADSATYASLLQHCALASALCHGMSLHYILTLKGLDLDLFIMNHLIHMYGKCDALEEACVVFAGMKHRNIFSWNIMIALHKQLHTDGMQGRLGFFSRMMAEGILPDKATFVTLISSITSPKSSFFGKCLHASVVGIGLEMDVMVGTALISMLSHCNSLMEAWFIFDCMPVQNVVSWSAMIAACVRHNEGEEALELFSKMEMQGLVPRKMTLVSCLSGCAILAAHSIGLHIHSLIISIGFDSSVIIGTALVDMYGKNGNLLEAVSTFDRMAQKTVLSWTVMMATYAMHGKAKQVLSLFQKMEAQGVMADNVAFLCAVSACSHLGLFEESIILIFSISHVYHLTPMLEHFNCLIDLLGRVGRLQEGEILLHSIPYQASDSSWLSLLAACRVHLDPVRAERAASHTFCLDPSSAVPYFLLTNRLDQQI
ncbi:hypothetical protein KP509_23G020600 [Ceratopteris richardii]|uniref:Pentatricopeptide repeat-containing protein n=1 Tax=Ceratopteris richardii TaxID=49495 RepID=A0A8T2RY49_CERRI|nr:hypothetical protein KP509_23G020600 [Ceratopteris richardii]